MCNNRKIKMLNLETVQMLTKGNVTTFERFIYLWIINIHFNKRLTNVLITIHRENNLVSLK